MKKANKALRGLLVLRDLLAHRVLRARKVLPARRVLPRTPFELYVSTAPGIVGIWDAVEGDGIDTPLEAFHRFLAVLCTMPKPLGYGPGRNRFNMTDEHLRLFRHAVLDLNYAVHGCSDEAVYEAYHHLSAVLHLMPEPLGYADHQSKEKIQAYRYELATADFPLDARPTPRSSRS